MLDGKVQVWKAIPGVFEVLDFRVRGLRREKDGKKYLIIMVEREETYIWVAKLRAEWRF